MFPNLPPLHQSSAATRESMSARWRELIDTSERLAREAQETRARAERACAESRRLMGQ